MADRMQNYKNHRRLFPLFHLFVLPVLLVNVLNEVRHVYQYASLHNVWMLVFAIGLLALALSARVMALTVQDRVIRLEMRQRLAQCLPAELQARIDDLSRGQLIALRFAGNTELPDLVREVLAGNLTRSNDIKMRVKEWQPDWLRA